MDRNLGKDHVLIFFNVRQKLMTSCSKWCVYKLYAGVCKRVCQGCLKGCVKGLCDGVSGMCVRVL